MEFLEKNLEDIIFETAQTEDGRIALRERGLEIPLKGKLFRQVNLGAYGVADLINVYIAEAFSSHTQRIIRELVIEIIELKRDEINQSALNQACRYARAVRVLVDRWCDRIDHASIHITLIGSSIDDSSNTSFVYLYNEMEHLVDVYTYSYKFDGIEFKYESHEWEKTKPNFPKDLISTLEKPGIKTLKNLITRMS